jgi:hypothetical protein
MARNRNVTVAQAEAAALTRGAPPVAALPFTPEEILERLAEPFDPNEIKWRATNTAVINDRRGRRLRGQVVAYADPRAYTDRLNDIFTPWGWTRDYAVQVAQNFERAHRGNEQRTITAKILVTCTVTLHGLGSHTGLGEEWADDENAGTAAEAQAFKRACTCFGLGRYLYDLPKEWVDLDEFKRPLKCPGLPSWALPDTSRQDSGPSNGKVTTAPANGNGRRGNGLYGAELRGAVEKLTDVVGFGLSLGVLKSVANVDAVEKVRDMTKLSIVMEKLENLARGVSRLRAAIDKVGPSRHQQLCQELNLPSDSIDDIPDCHTLRALVGTLEREAAEATV